jgi:uncharacterized protein (UPF0548 family)
MWSLTAPETHDLHGFWKREAGRPFSYPEVGHSREVTDLPGYTVDQNSILLGSGPEVFEAACQAMNRWEMFPRPWTRIYPAATAVREEESMTVAIKACGGWWLNACRIVYVIDEHVPIRRFGFAYGTLLAHAEQGEERFLVEWLEDDSVWYDIRAFSRPRFWGARLTKPLVRRLQRRFFHESQIAMLRSVQWALEESRKGQAKSE